MICLNKLNAFLLNQVNAFCFVPGSLFLVIACPTFLLLLLYDVVHKMMSKSFEDACISLLFSMHLFTMQFTIIFKKHPLKYILQPKILQDIRTLELISSFNTSQNIYLSNLILIQKQSYYHYLGEGPKSLKLPYSINESKHNISLPTT